MSVGGADGNHGGVDHMVGLETILRQKGIFFGIAAFAVTIAAGRWGMSLFTSSEFVHFSVNFPTIGSEPKLTREEIGGPWARLDAEKWGGIPAGGLLVFGTEGRITVDLGKRSVLKKIAQPNVLTLSSHWIRNVGKKARAICIDLEMCGMKTEYVTFEKAWDPEIRCSTRTIAPGKTFNMDWIVTLGEFVEKRIVCNGKVSIWDKKTGAPLAVLPIDIVNTSVPEAEAER